MLFPTGHQPSQAQLPNAACQLTLDTSASHPALALDLCPIWVGILISADSNILLVASG